ncbi:MAG: M15 family metallopeptidase [Rikenellaceae bacterium]
MKRLLLFLALLSVGFFGSWAQTPSEAFTISPISPEIFCRINGLSYPEGCELPLEELRYLKVLHVTAQGEVREGELICNKAIAQDLIEIFKVLFDAKYPIERVELVDNYQAQDSRSMRANNSSAFNYRYISGTKKLSNHSSGMAIDINPLYNPYVKITNAEVRVDPPESTPYANREQEHPYMIQKGDLLYREFIKRGFRWGGDWRSLKDYQHFEKPNQ